jgi:hypothetical protein
MADQVQINQAGVAVVYELADKIQVDGAGIVVIYSTIPEDLTVDLGLALVDIIPLPLSVQLGRRQYPVPTAARGYGSQNKRVFPTVK